MPSPVITPSVTTTYRVGADPLPSFSATGAGGQIQWSAKAGTFQPALTNNGESVIYTPLNLSDVLLIRATDVSDSLFTEVSLQLFATFPDRGQWSGVPRKLDDNMTASFAADGFGDFSESGPDLRSFEYVFPGRELSDYQVIRDFFLWHLTVRYFYLEDPQRDGVFYLVRFSEDLEDDNQGVSDIDISANFKQKPSAVLIETP